MYYCIVQYHPNLTGTLKVKHANGRNLEPVIGPWTPAGPERGTLVASHLLGHMQEVRL
jgi:hypothetical protein